jgi:hypothetical protein
LKQQEANEAADAPVPQDEDSPKDENSSQDSDDSSEGASNWSTRNEPGLNVSQRDVYEEARIICGLKSPRDVAGDFDLKTTNPDVIATRYARGYVASLKQPAYEGCFKGLTR